MKIEEDEFYLTSESQIIKYDFGYKLLNIMNTPVKMVAHIPKQLLNHLVVEVNNYHTDNEFKQMIDNVYGEKK